MKYLTALRQGIEEIGITYRAADAIQNIALHPNGIHMGDLADSLGISPSCATSYIKEALKYSLVTRHYRELGMDRRSVLVKLTEKGSGAVEQLRVLVEALSGKFAHGAGDAGSAASTAGPRVTLTPS